MTEAKEFFYNEVTEVLTPINAIDHQDYEREFQYQQELMMTESDNGKGFEVRGILKGGNEDCELVGFLPYEEYFEGKFFKVTERIK